MSLSLTLKTLQPAVHAALRAWQTLGGSSKDLLESLLLVQESQANVARNKSPAMLRRATNEVLLSAIEEMAAKEAQGARILRARFVDQNTIQKTAYRFNLSPDQVNRVQRAAIRQLTNTLLSRERAAREGQIQQMEARLEPPSYTHLFGFEHATATVLEELLAPTCPWVVAIVGMGGIGKTALADSVTRQLIGRFHFDEVIWLRVEGHWMTLNLTPEKLWAYLAQKLWPQKIDTDDPAERAVRVRLALKSKPYLIVIDNLEAKADTALLLQHLRDLATPSKFLLTTRTRPPGQAGVFTLSLSELTPHDAASLIRHHAATIGLKDLANVSDAEAESIYQVTGGNPLVLKLVVSLAAVLPLPVILADLKRNRSGQIEEMYRHIYWKAWQTLSQEARLLLLTMPLVAKCGGRPEYLMAISELSETQLWPAISELVSRSLLEVQGTTWDRRYRIHRLTETFLHTEIIEWPENGVKADVVRISS